MPKYSTAFGMDVHLRSTTVCASTRSTGEAVARRFPGRSPGGQIAGWTVTGSPGRRSRPTTIYFSPFSPTYFRQRQRGSPDSPTRLRRFRHLKWELAGLGVECVVAAVASNRSPGRPPTRPPRTTGTTPPGWLSTGGSCRRPGCRRPISHFSTSPRGTLS